MDKIKIMTDTASDITLEIAEKYGIHLVPINFVIDGKNVKDKIDISTAEFYKYMSTHCEIPKTSQVTVADHIDEFKKFCDEYSIIYVTISSKGSGSMQSAVLAKNEILEENPNADITIIDSMSFTYGYGYHVIQAAKMANAGAKKEEIISMLRERIPKTEIILSVETLEYLQKGGRISPTAKILANVLDITPILAVEDGLVMSREKVRGKKKVISKMTDMVLQNADLESDMPIIIMQGNVPDKAEKMRDMIAEKTGRNDSEIVEVGACIGIHTGPGVIAYIYQKK